MPYINLKTNCTLNDQNKTLLKSGLGKAIELIPGKSEQWLMMTLEGDHTMYFGGRDDKGICLVDVCCYGEPNADAYAKVTAAVCDLMHEVLGVDPADVYIKYSETMYWGGNGVNL